MKEYSLKTLQQLMASCFLLGAPPNAVPASSLLLRVNAIDSALSSVNWPCTALYSPQENWLPSVMYIS